MRKFANYMILPEHRLILECCKREAIVADAISMKKAEISDDLYNPDYNICVDFREFESTLNSTLIESTKNFFDFIKTLNINSRIAILTTAPHQVFISLILKELSKKSGYVNIEAFSTLDAAIMFLGIPVKDLGFINSKVLELNKNTA